VVFRKLRKDYQKFLETIKKTKEKPIKKPKIKPKIINIPDNNFEATESTEGLNNVFNHRKGRMKEWHSQYGQGMYDS